MLKIFNELKPFFNNTYREISVREFAKEIKVTPPTASTILKKYEQEKILKKREFKRNLLFRANKENDLFENLAKIFWKTLLRGELENLHKKAAYKQIILFGSIAKAENTNKSDIDLFINIPKKQINTRTIEKKLKREIQLHFKEELANKNLKNNIQKGIRIF